MALRAHGRISHIRACVIFRPAHFVTSMKTNMKIRALRSILAIIAISVLLGCAAPVSIKTYDGLQLPAEATSVLMVDRQIFVSDVAGYKTGITLGAKAES